MDDEKKKYNKKYGIDKLRSNNDAWQSAVCSETHIEINGNYEAIIEGCKGILSYREEEIRLNTENGQLKLRGRNLQIICMGEASMIVRGYIIGTEYDN